MMIIVCVRIDVMLMWVLVIWVLYMKVFLIVLCLLNLSDEMKLVNLYCIYVIMFYMVMVVLNINIIFEKWIFVCNI